MVLSIRQALTAKKGINTPPKSRESSDKARKRPPDTADGDDDITSEPTPRGGSVRPLPRNNGAWKTLRHHTFHKQRQFLHAVEEEEPDSESEVKSFI